MADVWAEAAPDERIELAAKRMFFLFATSDPAPGAWEAMSDAAKESWREAAQVVLKP